MDLATRLIFGPAFVVAAVLSPIITLKSFCIFYFVVLALGFRRRSNLPSQKSAWLWLLATPAIKIIQAVIATPIRFYALATIRHDVWGSRKDPPSCR